ncbi:cGMP-dependent 3',5'-cyclic phosphodiesterase-like [Oratosquilla oratoria]|uniref:cGMP-dependent 3',5'-cyclic phosphodiesterase-like n=1 Tax=Oratosquilla oratoria TaxID=337810 RepID=UPI003F76F94A
MMTATYPPTGGMSPGVESAPPKGKSDPLALLDLLRDLRDRSSAGLHKKINKYLEEACRCRLSLLLLEEEEEQLHLLVLGSCVLPTPVKTSVLDNAFSLALASPPALHHGDLPAQHLSDVPHLLALASAKARHASCPTSAPSSAPSSGRNSQQCDGLGENGVSGDVIGGGALSGGNGNGQVCRSRGGGCGGSGGTCKCYCCCTCVSQDSLEKKRSPSNTSSSSSSFRKRGGSSRSLEEPQMPGAGQVHNHKNRKMDTEEEEEEEEEEGGRGVGGGGGGAVVETIQRPIVEKDVSARNGGELPRDTTGGGGSEGGNPKDHLDSTSTCSSSTDCSPSSPRGSTCYLANNYCSAAADEGGPPLSPNSPKSFVFVPVSPKGGPRVLVCLVDKLTAEDFGPEDVEIVQTCFRYVLSAVLTAAELDRERRARRQCQALLSVAQNLFTHLEDVDVLLREIMAEARQLTSAERCSLFLLDRERNQLVAKVFDGEAKNENQDEVRISASEGIAGRVALTGKLLNIRDAYAHPLFYRGLDQTTGFRTRSILCFPIKSGERVIGVAELCNKANREDLHFTAMDEEIATAFSVYCALSISHSLLYKKVSDAQFRSNLSNELMMFHMKVTKEEVEKLVHVQVPEPESFHPDFCSFKYFPRQLTESSTPLAVVSMLDRLGFITRWQIRRDTLARFTLMVRKGYRDPPYHNWIHAFSVTHFAFLTLHNLDLTATKALTDLEALALVFSSLCHDLDHRGTTNSFQVASNSVLASLYSSEGSVMERHHLAQTMCILNTQDCNVFENLSQQQYTQCLDLMRDIILATDLAHHLRLLGEIKEMARRGYNSSSARDHFLLTCLLMTAADLSDQTKDWVSSKRVAELIYKEFFTQGDLEKAMGNMPIEMMDREKAFIPELQLGFVDNIALPVYEILGILFPPAVEPYECVKANRRNWARLRDVYKRRKHESTSSLEVFEDDSSLEEELAAAVLEEDQSTTS